MDFLLHKRVTETCFAVPIDIRKTQGHNTIVPFHRIRGGDVRMKRLILCSALLLTIAVSVSAMPLGFTGDFAQAKEEASQSGKLIFTYFHLNG